MKKQTGPNTVPPKLKKKLKGNITVSTRKTWFSDAMAELDKQKVKQ